MKSVWIGLWVVLVGCGDIDHPPAPEKCDSMAKFAEPTLVAGLGRAGFNEGVPRLSPDELTIYFSGGLPSTLSDLYVAHRSSLQDEFLSPVALEAQNSAAHEFDPTVSSDGLQLWFSSEGSDGRRQLYSSIRSSLHVEFSRPGLAVGVNSSGPGASHEGQPYVTAKEEELWFTSTREDSSSWDIWYATKTPAGFAAPVNVRELNSSSEDYLPMLSADRLTVYFSSDRRERGKLDIWSSHRSIVTDGFPPPRLVEELNSNMTDYPGWLSADACRIYFTSNRRGDADIYMATRQKEIAEE